MQLNKLVGKSENGKEKKIGDLLAFRDAKDLYHLDKINEPKDENDSHQIFKRSTSLTMEGLDVDASTIKSCLNVDNTKEMEDLFELDFLALDFLFDFLFLRPPICSKSPTFKRLIVINLSL